MKARTATLLARRRPVVHTHVTYPLTLWVLVASSGRRGRRGRPAQPDWVPSVSLIAAYDEEDVIAAKVANALALDYPRERLELIVASDGSADATAGAPATPAPASSSSCRGAARSPR